MARREITISGLVQGVGFRPFVFDLARRLGVQGCVRNQAGSVYIEVEGEPPLLDAFLSGLAIRPPPLARIASLTWESRMPRGAVGFRIEASDGGDPASIFVGPDAATCDDCRAELFDPGDRRYRYPFLNCTNCGPRLTVIRGLPYDRERTTLASFPLCSRCRAEYDDPTDRRFHAQPTACPACGPRLALRDSGGQPLPSADPLATAVAALREGRIVAIKGLGGYHLACDASNERAVADLRRRKARDEKPFALMAADRAAAGRLGELSDVECDLLQSPRRPIVLVRRRPSGRVAPSVAPHHRCVGVMLPYTPLHHLLMHDLDGTLLVMTSGNRSDEPIAVDDADALTRLAGIADLFLTHDRPIHLRCDDSVTRVVAGVELPVRRSRGQAPAPLTLPTACSRPALAVGGQLKAVFALGRGRHAFLSHHQGDLDHFEAFQAYVQAVEHYERLFEVRPELIIHDLHPDYASTLYAQERARREGLSLLAVQHHHAHLASCLAEHGLDGPAIGVIFDGAGHGTDGTIWGGEVLVGDCRTFRRAAHLRPVPLPGGDQAVREPWRMALSYLLDAGRPPRDMPGARIVARMVERRFNSPLTSSAGRLFDAVAALAGLRSLVSYEGQAAAELENLATEVEPDGVYPFDTSGPVCRERPPRRSVTSIPRTDIASSEGRNATEGVPYEIDTRPLIAEVDAEAARGVPVARIARRFHTTLVEIIAQVCRRLRAETGLQEVVLSGGVFSNAILTEEAPARLMADGFRVLRHRRVPPGDGGLCLGQLAVAAVQNIADGTDFATGSARRLSAERSFPGGSCERYETNQLLPLPE